MTLRIRHVWTCDLLSSKARQIRVALLSGKKNDLYNRAYDRKGGPDKSATRITNLQAQSPKGFFLGGIASCSVQLLLRVLNVQAIHEYQLVHAQGHVHDALDSSPQYRMQLHDLMLYSSLRLFNMQFGISGKTGLRHHPFAKHCCRVAAAHLQVATVLCELCTPKRKHVARHVARDPDFKHYK